MLPIQLNFTDAFGEGRAHEVDEALRPRALPKDGHRARIAAEAFNIVPDPCQRRNLIEQSIVPAGLALAFLREPGMRQETEPRHPVLDRHENDPEPGEPISIVKGRGGRAAAKTTAGNPHHDWQPRVSI